MDAAKSYEEIVDFFAKGTTPELVIALRLSLQERVPELSERANDCAITSEERAELEDCLQLDRAHPGDGEGVGNAAHPG